jgi:16S rRNA (uracil1498-N3)-methyltransferase
LTRIYFPDQIPDHGLCQLPVAKAHHVAHVLRLAPGDAVTLFDGQGNAWDAVISKCARGDVSVQLKARREEDRESPLQLTLAQAVSSGERMDYTIQKAVELGVNRIVPLATDRSTVKLDDERARKRGEHWFGIMRHAAERAARRARAHEGARLAAQQRHPRLVAQDAAARTRGGGVHRDDRHAVAQPQRMEA